MGSGMKFAVGYSSSGFGTDPDRIIAYAQHAETCGFEALYVPEHLVLYPGAQLHSFDIAPSVPFRTRSTPSPSSPRPPNDSCWAPGYCCCRTGTRWCSPNSWRPSTSCPKVGCGC